VNKLIQLIEEERTGKIILGGDRIGKFMLKVNLVKIG